MAFTNIIRVSEFEKLYYDEAKPFKQKHWQALCRYAESNNKNETSRIEYFRIINKGVQFTNYVGVIQAGNLTIEVLPKIDNASGTAANENISDLEQSVSDEKQKWQSALLQMLKECRFLNIHQVDYANLNFRSNSILEIYLELFIAEAEMLLHEGLIKKYKKKEGNQRALKGRMIFAKQIAYNSTHQERVYVRFTEYSSDNIYNQILYKALKLIPKISNSAHLLDKVGRLLLDFPEVSNGSINVGTFERLQIDRKTERYKEAILIAKMLLLNYRPDITGGSENVIAILFDMNMLWEEWVYRRLKKEERPFGITVQRQQSEPFWDADHLSRAKTIRPDIVVIEGEKTTVIDTKWKLVEDMVPSDADLKQMFIYNLFWKCDSSILLYPANAAAHKGGKYFDFQKVKDHHSECGLLSATIFDSYKLLDKGFGEKVLKSIGFSAKNPSLLDSESKLT